MSPSFERLDSRELDVFARMHREVLPGSLVARLGADYTRKFYDYVNDSETEGLLTRRRDGRIVAGCVLSLDPSSLTRRLLLATPVASSALRAFGRLPWLQLVRGALSRGRDSAPSHPEIILIFTTPEARGQGLGAELVGDAESLVRGRGHDNIMVKTLADPGNRALAFYRRCGFDSAGEVLKFGKRLAVFTKSVGLGPSSV